MGDCLQFLIPDIECEQYQIREVLRCLLQTIIFTRALGVVRPREVDCELFDITYITCGDANIDGAIDEKLNVFCAVLERSPSSRGQMCLSFYEKRTKKAWFSKHEERLYWEQWLITIMVNRTPPPGGTHARSQRQQILEQELRDRIAFILARVNEKRDHVPPVVTPDLMPFAYEISIPSSSESWGLDMFKRMLQTTPPMLG
mmetsp:Transcript_16376/g.27042  ORF Transcript_16376/g.27042 Transcript_16376/m.27042 type:complete len:201 (+) Transcript_16376:139-741(+)